MNNLKFFAVVKTCFLVCWFTAICHGSFADDATSGAVVLEERGHAWLLRDRNNMSLYVSRIDQVPGKSACVDACAERWPPLTAADDAVSDDDWQIINRDDGSRQWSFRGKPLYLYSGDKAPGDDFGEGFGNAWQIATKSIDLPATVAVRRTMLGHILVTADSEASLYYFDADEPEGSSCNMRCAQTWLPLKASQLANGRGDWSIVTRRDGTRQWAYRDTPLYRYSGDWNPGDTLGHQVDGSWLVAVLEPPPPIPDWVTVQGSDGGFVLADRNGKTIYAQATSRIYAPPEDIHAKRQLAEPDCGVECRGSRWQPVIAAADERAVASWSVIDRKDGRRQWAYRGEPLYVNVRDTIPGALHGVYSGNRSWHALMWSGKSMQGTGN